MGIFTTTHVRGAHAGLKATILAFDIFKTKTNAEGCYTKPNPTLARQHDCYSTTRNAKLFERHAERLQAKQDHWSVSIQLE